MKRFSPLLFSFKSPRHWVITALFLVLCSGVWTALADFLPDFTVGSMAAPKSQIALRRAEKKQKRQRLVRIERKRERRKRRQNYRTASIRKVRRAPVAIKFVRFPTPAKSTPKKNSPPSSKSPTKPPRRPTKPSTLPSKPTPAPVIVEETVQNVNLQLVNPKNQPIADLSLDALLYPKTGDSIRLTDLKTDERGQIRLQRIQLPVLIELKLTGEFDETDAAPPITQISGTPTSEWEFQDANSGLLEVLRPEGKIVGARFVQNSTDQPRFASLQLPLMAQASRTRRREIVYESTPKPIIVRRTLVDLTLTAPPQSQISSPILSQPLQVPDDGKLMMVLRADELESGAVPLRVAANLPGGQAESVVEKYTTDPYSPNQAVCPPLQLVRLAHFQTAGNIGVFEERAKFVSQFGDLSDKKEKRRPPGQILDNGDGSRWWLYSAQGIAFKCRKLPFGEEKNATWIVERVRVLNRNGGSLGAVGVGSSREESRKSLGVPETAGRVLQPAGAVSPLGNASEIESYLDGGLRIGFFAGKITWFEFVRPPTLLKTGTTAFVSRQPAKLFIEKFTGHPRTNLETVFELKRYLEQVRAVRVTDRRDEADLILNARVTEFTEDKDEVTDLIPYRYDCTTKLSYGLTDALSGEAIQPTRVVSGSAKADYGKQVIGGSILAAVLGKYGGELGEVGAVALVGGGIYQLHRRMQKAVNRCPGISARTVFNTMATDISRAADFSMRVTEIDYKAGTLRLNAGRHLGIAEKDEFQILVAENPLSVSETGLSASYYVAVARLVSEDSTLCELRHVSRKVKKTSENFDYEDAKTMLQRLPDPATGAVSARAWVNFPEIPIISDADLEVALQKAQERETRAEAQRTQQSPRDNTPRHRRTSPQNTEANDPLGRLLDEILKPKR